MEYWNSGRMKEWKVGRMEGWKIGGMGDLWVERVVLSSTYQVKFIICFIRNR